jgi:hypothetical protein
MYITATTAVVAAPVRHRRRRSRRRYRDGNGDCKCHAYSNGYRDPDGNSYGNDDA